MKPNRTTRFLPCSALGLAGFLLLHARVEGASFAYTNCDLIACFRAEGGAADLVVDLGPAAGFEGLAWGSVVALPGVTAAQLSAAFPALNSVKWSVLGAMRGNPNYPQFPLQTVWVTSASPMPGVPGAVWKRQSQFTQGTVASQIEGIGSGAVTYGSQQPGGPNNTANGVVISSGDQNSLTLRMTPAGNLAGTFQGNAEHTTPADFDTQNAPASAGLYKLIPGSGGSLNAPGEWLGEFTLLPDGTMTFTAGPPSVRIATVQRSGDVTTFTFPTVPAGTYRLRCTDAAGLLTPVAGWSPAGETLAGDGAVRSLRHTNSASSQFYVVEVLP